MKSLSLEKLTSSGMTGRDVKVAVVDSGINPWHSHVRGIAGGVKIALGGTSGIIFDDKDIHDKIGHGTACAGVIRKKAPESKLYSVKIFEEMLSTYTTVLIEAIQWCVDNRMDIINLSLGTENKEYLYHLRKVCKDAFENRIIVIVAAKDKESYPAYFPEVIGVTIQPGCQENMIFYRETSPIKFLASNYPIPIHGLPTEYNFKGESFTSAHLSGFITLLRERYPLYGTEEIRNLLSNLCQDIIC